MKRRLRDIVIVLPGITGSVLQHDGRDVWAISRGGVWNALTSLGRSFDHLVLEDDDPDVDDLGDGVTAPRLMGDVHLVPGLVKIDGYGRIMQMLEDEFEMVPGQAGSDQPANLYPFPYDWRRDNRVAARKLQQLVESALPRWREHTGAQDAQVILLAHSMGGLVARHYLEVLGGHEHCRALITFGTPYRGSLNAVDFLANGFKKLLLDLTHLLRSFTSVYQLLPIYPAVEVGGAWTRVAEADLPGVDRQRATAALEFHRAIESAVEDRRSAGGDYTLLPFLGTRQPTKQSAVVDDGMVRVGRELPTGIDPLLGDGDGTVPRLSAIPIELSEEYRDTFITERHSSLQNHGGVLGDIRERLVQMQIEGLAAIRGPTTAPQRERAAAIALDLDDLYLPTEPVRVEVTRIGTELPVQVAVAPVEGGAPTFVEVEGEDVELPGLPP
ncbi:MAG: hypothetical protein R3320_10155, partial [Nitriliruptorales bacterium]|nr:hypothetical protein [Nitriliruptorales bacterium]